MKEGKYNPTSSSLWIPFFSSNSQAILVTTFIVTKAVSSIAPFELYINTDDSSMANKNMVVSWLNS